MKLISWNVNGLRAVHRKEMFLPFVKKEDPDILLIQEVKAEVSQLPDEVKNIPDYESYFTHPREKKGYSGVALYTKIKPKKVTYIMNGKNGEGEDEHHEEGRLIVAYYDDFVLLNVYFPNGGGGPVRLKYKLDFYDEFLAYIEKLKRAGKKIIFTGDINTAHEEIDLARPKENEKNTGFLPEERAWLDEVVASGYIDTFRHFHPNKKEAYSYWDMKTAARDRNVGWRLDYFFTSGNLAPRLKSADILSTVYGSDHCPVVLELKQT